MSPLILVVDDETILGDSICAYLEHHGYTTAIARSGEEGIRLAEENSPDVLCGYLTSDRDGLRPSANCGTSLPGRSS
jgi:CheY-like chemotaxis protein